MRQRIRKEKGLHLENSIVIRSAILLLRIREDPWLTWLLMEGERWWWRGDDDT
jgi:hypothetical protein